MRACTLRALLLSPRQGVNQGELWLGLGLGLEEVFLFDSKRENRDRAVESGVSVRVKVRVMVSAAVTVRAALQKVAMLGVIMVRGMLGARGRVGMDARRLLMEEFDQ